MATTTKQNTQYCTTAPSIDANIGPWASIDAYLAWLSSELGVDAPQEGTEILVKDSTGAMTKYRYEVISGETRWVTLSNNSEFKGTVGNADALNRVIDYGVYYLDGTPLKGLLSVSYDENAVVQHLLANKTPVYSNGSISSYTSAGSFLVRRYVNSAWSSWTDALSAAVSTASSAANSAASSASTASTSASNAEAKATLAETSASAARSSAATAAMSATTAANSATSAAAALATIQAAIENLDPSESEQEAIVALTAQIASLRTVVSGGDEMVYEDIKDEGTLYSQWRIYGASGSDECGKILAGDTSCSIYKFSVNEGDVIRLTGLKNSDNNDSMCWAVYSSDITPAVDSTTAAALAAALLASSSDTAYTPGRTDVDTTISMPSGAAMLIVSVPYSDDDSTIEKQVATSSSGLVSQVASHTSAIAALQSATAVLPSLSGNVANLNTNVALLNTTTTLLKGCASVNVKSLISDTRNAYGLVNGGRITMDGKVVRGEDGCTTYIVALSQFADPKFSASGLGNSSNNDSLCWAVFNIAEDDVDWNGLVSGSYQLNWSSYLMSSYSDPDDTAGRTGVNIDSIDLTASGATFIVFSVPSSAASMCEIRNYDSTAISSIKENADKAAELIVLENKMGEPSKWGARTSASSGYSTAVMTLHSDYANIKVTTSAATSGERGMWLGFYARNLVAGRTYMIVTRYKVNVGLGSALVVWYYNSDVEWSLDGFPRIRIEDDTDRVWKYDVGSQYFQAPASGDLWLDFVVKVSDTTSGATTSADFDILPMVFDIKDTGLTADSLQALIEKTGAFFDKVILPKFAINPLRSIMSERLVTLGDSTTGMMMWQPYLAKIKGWDWDARQIGGLTFSGVSAPYTAMGIGSTACEPIIYGGGAAGAGYSQYIRARYAKYYNPTTIIVMSSYNGAHNGAHWGDDSAKPVQPDDYGLAALVASGMNNDTGTYNGTYMGDEVNLVNNPSQAAPSFAASFFGMVYRLIVDNPAARIILITLMTDFATSDAEYLTLKNAVIEKAGEVFHLQVIDANKCGINRTNRLTTRYDNGGVHFNEAGGLLLAKYIASQV